MTVLDGLRIEDREVLWGWLREQLVWHLKQWADACHLGWDDNDVDARIRKARLVEKEWTQLLTAADARDSLVRVARDADGVPVGAVYAISRPDPYLGVPLGVLSWLHVDRAARGQGLSRPLIDAALHWFASRGVPLAEVHVTASNDAAVKTYARGGFEIVDHRMLVGIRRPGLTRGGDDGA